MEAQEIVRQARDAGVKLVMFAYCDNSGIIRGKATHVSGLERRLTSGIGAPRPCRSWATWTNCSQSTAWGRSVSFV